MSDRSEILDAIVEQLRRIHHYRCDGTSTILGLTGIQCQKRPVWLYARKHRSYCDDCLPRHYRSIQSQGHPDLYRLLDQLDDLDQAGKDNFGDEPVVCDESAWSRLTEE